MTLKTDYRYNEDDFTERSGQLDELTVTLPCASIGIFSPSRPGLT